MDQVRSSEKPPGRDGSQGFVGRAFRSRWLFPTFGGVVGVVLSQWLIDAGYRRTTLAALGLFAGLAGMLMVSRWLRRLPARAPIFAYAPAFFACLAGIAAAVAFLLPDAWAPPMWGGVAGLTIGIADQLHLLVRHQAQRPAR